MTRILSAACRFNAICVERAHFSKYGYGRQVKRKRERERKLCSTLSAMTAAHV
jgi:hypothetical protein